MPMINAQGRLTGSQLLQDLLDGKITNDEYNDSFPDSSLDAGLHVVYRRIWFYYSDLHTHYLDTEEMAARDIALFRRCVAFLKTDLEYKGPPIELHFPWRELFGRLLCRGDKPVSLFGSATDEASPFLTNWWPFASLSECEEVLQTVNARPE